MHSIATLNLWRKTFPPRRQPRAAPISPLLVLLLVFLVVIGIGLVKADSGKSVCRIKGVVDASGERIYYLPTHEHYSIAGHSKGEQWFCSEWEGWFSGYHKAKG